MTREEKGWATLNTITVHSESGMDTDSAVVAGDYLCWLDTSCKVIMLDIKSLDSSANEKLIEKKVISLEGDIDDGISLNPCSLLFALHAMPSQAINWKYLGKMSNHLQVTVDDKASIHNLS